MAGRVANCPNCGGGVEFRAGTSLLTVCPYCSSAVARVGGDITHLEVTGQVAPLADVGSPLRVGTRGTLRNRSFVLLGRAQYDYGAGPWNEWYAAFDDGRWGWVAEAEGRVIISFEAPMDDPPSFAQADVGSHLRLSDHRFTVVERRQASLISAEGELPFPVTPGGSFRYCDLEGPGRAFGTLDFGEGDEVQHLYLGERLDYADAFEADVLHALREIQAQAAVGLNCPNCGAGIELKAPDAAMRVTCGRCDALLDCTRGSELFLLQAAQPPATPPRLPLGESGRLLGRDYTVLGHLVRSVTVDGVRYPWEEYLLHAREVGYRWLVDANGHWTFVEPVNAGEVIETGRSVRYQRQSFRHFTSGAARVDGLRGEFYWKVQVGELVATADYVQPPFVLSKERAADEVTWSKGVYVEPEIVRSAFSVKTPWRKPRGVAPSQPNPHRAPLRTTLRAAVAFSVALVVLALGFAFWQNGRTVVDAQFEVDPAQKQLVSTEPFELTRLGSLALRATAPVDNAWLYLAGQLVHLPTEEVIPFGIEVSYYHGVSGGERWAEGGRSRTVYLGEVPAGRYVIRLRPSGPPVRSARTGGARELPLRIEAQSRVFMTSHAFGFLVLLWLWPLLHGAIYLGFEKRRWAESDHAE